MQVLNLKNKICLILVVCCLGCIYRKTPDKYAYEPLYTKTIRPFPEEDVIQDSSLWNESNRSNSLFLDNCAYRLNDIVTVIIVEIASASKKATTKTGRTSSLAGGVKGFFGAKTADRVFGDNAGSLLGSDLKSDFEGQGTTDREESLEAKITARVIDILPNGNLVIEGKREIIVNGEKQIINIRGIIRPNDISSDNTIESTYIADAQIEYGGRGIISDKQHPGWFTRILDWVTPF
ncbi:MAG: flagellar basal body L-ring protein FlgH [bacterium]